jgi:hypothetical protein
MFVEFIDIAEEYLGVDLLLAVEIKVDRSLAEFGFLGNVLYGNRFEALLEKKLPSRFEYGMLPVIPLPFSSFFQSQELPPSVSVDRVRSHISADGLRVSIEES